MKPGDVVVTTHINQVLSSDTRLGYKANKGRHLVFIYLGDEPKDGDEPLDPIKALNDLGWELEKELADDND